MTAVRIAMVVLGTAVLFSGCSSRKPSAAAPANATEPARPEPKRKAESKPEPEKDPRLSGKLRLLDGQGKPTAGLTATLDGHERAYVEAGLRAAAVWLFEGLQRKDFAYGMAIDMDFREVRPPYLPFESRALVASPESGRVRAVGPLAGCLWITVTLRNPRTALEKRACVMDLLYDARCVVPRKIESLQGLPEPVDLVDDLIDGGRLEVVVRPLHRGRFLAVRQQDLRLPPPNTPAPQPPAAPAVDLGSLPAGPPYARALAACRSAWRQYNAAVVKTGTEGLPSHVIFVDREQQIGRQTEAVLAECLAALRPEAESPKDVTPCLQAATVAMMLDKHGEAVSFLSKAASLDKRYRFAMVYLRGKRRYDEARLVEALDDLREAVRLEPGNAEAVARLRKLCEAMDRKLPQELAAAVSKAEPSSAPMVQVLPWRRIYALDPALSKLGEPIPVRPAR